MTTIGLLGGELLDYTNPDPALIDLETMAHVLGGVPRFGGHTIRFVYVDEHSSRVGRFARLDAEQLHPGDVRMHDLCELHGNLHDGHETYTPWGDITDGKTDEMRKVEAGIDAAIFQHLGLEPPSDAIKAIVKRADKRALWIEARLWAPSAPRWTDLQPPPAELVETLLGLTWPRPGECWLRRTNELLATLGPGNQSSKALWANVEAAQKKARRAAAGGDGERLGDAAELRPGAPIQVTLGSSLPMPGEDLRSVVIIGYTDTQVGAASWVSDHGMTWARGVGVGIINNPRLSDHPPDPLEIIRGSWDLTAGVDTILAKHFEGIGPLTTAALVEAHERGRRSREAHFDPRAVAMGTFPTHIGPGGAHYSDGTILRPDVVEDFERLKRVADARALLSANGWVEDEPGRSWPGASGSALLWSPAPELGWWIDIRTKCPPAILRALAIIAEEAQP